MLLLVVHPAVVIAKIQDVSCAVQRLDLHLLTAPMLAFK